ncbi:hypothetical protein PHLGIDRAFT_69512 [Phlebiopsis gigantea 11061_1 CR5-6]|uniref:Methylenetetrahydrofolate dehydrogenase n=1 Tax=Phlebiopsis gigantea (strain 11061_1 CR5-6) TaxID=745531 RepID=A0A0C3NSY1_PHLG1|nr:hypothetical protein PHLGIDRAFT_69512 [Phlebiopsis gigantea 11061_1 CR5-6]
MVPDHTGKGILLKADPIASAFRDEIKAAISQNPARAPKLIGILATSAAPSKFYADFTKKQCDELGVEFVLKTIGAAADPALSEGEGVEEAIIEANNDESVDGIMVYYPIFGVQQDHYLQQASDLRVVSPLKDVEGLHFKFHYNLYHKVPPVVNDTAPEGHVKSILPCTPLATVKCLEHIGVYNKILPYGDRAYGKTITVINRSEVVGRPLAALLANDGARVLSVDIDSIQEYTKRPRQSGESEQTRYHPRHVVHPSTLTLQDCLAISDVVVSAVPSASYKVKTEWLKDGCVCVNVAADKNFEKDVRDKASVYMPTIGKATIMMLLRNLYVLTPECASVAVLTLVSNSMRLRSYREVQHSASQSP